VSRKHRHPLYEHARAVQEELARDPELAPAAYQWCLHEVLAAIDGAQRHVDQENAGKPLLGAQLYQAAVIARLVDVIKPRARKVN
jgi:hypothetical protein